MKKLFIAFLLLISLNGFSQKQKTGHIDLYKIAMETPEMKVATSELETYHDERVKELKELEKHINDKIAEFEAQKDSLSELILKLKEHELEEYMQRMEVYQITIAEQLDHLNKELTDPIVAKINEAIKKVADDNGFTYILNTNTTPISAAPPEKKFNFRYPWGDIEPAIDLYPRIEQHCEATVLYFNNGIDVTDLVKKELGIN